MKSPMNNAITQRFEVWIPLIRFEDNNSWSDDNLNPLKPKLVWILFMNSVRTAKKTLHLTITKISWVNPLKPKLVFIIFTNRDRTAKKTLHLTIRSRIRRYHVRFNKRTSRSKP
jgi:hypothetical protein